MTVTRTCPTAAATITVNRARQERVRHTVDESGSVVFTLKDHAGRMLLESRPAQSEQVREWPLDGDPMPDGDGSHVVGMQFAAQGRVKWKVELLSAQGTVLSVAKECQYQNDTHADDYYDTLRVFITEGP